MSMTDTTFDELLSQAQTQGVDAALETLAQRMRAEHKAHELFDLRLMQARNELKLPIIVPQSLDELPEPLRNKMEESYLAACREVGHLLLAEGRLREAWMYLRPIGDKEEVAAALAKLPAELVNDITQQQGKPPTESTIAGLVADRDWLFANDNYHVDTTHLSSVVRFAQLVEDPEVLRLAVDLT